MTRPRRGLTRNRRGAVCTADPDHHGNPGIAEDWLEGPPVGYTLLHVPKRLDDIPVTDTCPVCGNTAHRTLLVYETPYRESGKICLARCEEVPGHRCDVCETKTYDLEASIQVLLAAREVACRAGDRAAVEDLDALIPADSS